MNSSLQDQQASPEKSAPRGGRTLRAGLFYICPRRTDRRGRERIALFLYLGGAIFIAPHFRRRITPARA